MPAPCMSVALQQRKWRQAGKVAIPNLILQEEGKIKMTRKGTGMDVKSKEEQNRPSYNSSVGTPPNIINHRKNENPAESNMLKVDERLRLARERREENLRQLALRERGWLAREERARRYYEKHLEERRKKLDEQRQREERRRLAVEEKRKQRLKEEKDRFESVVQKTMAKSQKTEPKTARSSQRGASSGKNNKKAKRRSLSQWEINLVSRLQTPTISYLARSRSAVCLSQSEVSCHSVNNTSAQKSGQSPATSTQCNVIRPGLIRGKHQTSSKEAKSKKNKLQSLTDSARVNSTPGRVKQNKPVSLLTGLPVRQMSPRQECLPALTEEEDLKLETIPSYHQPQKCIAAPSNVHEVGCKGPAWKNIDSTGSLVPPACPYTATEPSIHSAGVQSRPQAGTTDPEKASRLLAEKRRQARMQREREEEERRLKEETERQEREVLSCQKAHEWVRQEAETLELQEQKGIREDEKQINAENENTQQQEEEKQKLQHQKEEEEAQQTQVAEQQRIERESRFQREETERQERKKRLEEIMKRTRKTDAAEKKVVSSNLIIKETLPDEIMKPIHSLPLEEVIRLPGTASVSKMGLDNEEDILPAVAFKERRSIRTITGLEEIQAHQRAEVI